MQKAGITLIWLLAILLGISVGAGLYEARVVLPGWASSPPATWINSGTRFWAFVSTGPLTLTILAGFAVFWNLEGPALRWWLAALLIALVERAATFSYFIPTMVMLQRQQVLSAEHGETLVQWSKLNYGRHALTIAAWLFALKALSMLGSPTSLVDKSATRRPSE